eukprot:COSAG01_NODE_3606_length_5878_cov_276.025437_4_plen_214_part_00
MAAAAEQESTEALAPLLLDMGFAEDQGLARVALRECGGDVSGAAELLLLRDGLEAGAVQRLVQMGFSDPAACRRALMASHGCADTAVQQLLARGGGGCTPPAVIAGNAHNGVADEGVPPRPEAAETEGALCCFNVRMTGVVKYLPRVVKHTGLVMNSAGSSTRQDHLQPRKLALGVRFQAAHTCAGHVLPQLVIGVPNLTGIYLYYTCFCARN